MVPSRIAPPRSWIAICAGTALVLLLIAVMPSALRFASHPARATEEPNPVSSVKPDQPPKHTNRLIDETSPYLLQHAHNPVDWYPWGDEALDKAKAEDKPIFLSIGYSACHWCHVMAHESFESESIATILNEHFVSIKVDREERPDLDEIYMTAVQIMTGSGGWPMTVFMTPDLKPFFGGTYFPPDDRFGRPGFGSLLNMVVEEWDQNRAKIDAGADQLTGMIRTNFAMKAESPGQITEAVLDTAVSQLAGDYDETYGGFGDAPKFPSSPSISLLLRQHARTGDAQALDMAVNTLKKMYYGGMYDHLGGGFHRYSVDEQWLVPHFEKMLYDNAQLAKVYLDAYQATRDPLFRHVAEDIFHYELDEMLDENGAFHSTEDADSEGQEGKFYIWTKSEILSILGDEDGALFCTYYNVADSGNFPSHEPYHKGQNILHITTSPAEIASSLGLTETDLEARMVPMRQKLFEIRAKRVRPGLDDKILTSWNAMMISALVKGYQVTGEEKYRIAAEGAANFILKEMVVDGELMRTHRKGVSKVPAYLDDYAFLTNALIDLYEATFDLKWLEAAAEFMEQTKASFWDAEHGGFYYTTEDHQHLLTRTKPTYDGAEPSGNSVAAEALLRLAKLLDNAAYYDMAEQMFAISKTNLERAPRAFLYMIGVADFYLNAPKEIAIAGSTGSGDVAELWSAVHNMYLPNKVMAYIDPAADGAEALEKRVPLLAGKTLIDGKAAAYVCKDFACQRPVTTPDALMELLEAK